jgi:hypothetical protein
MITEKITPVKGFFTFERLINLSKDEIRDERSK